MLRLLLVPDERALCGPAERYALPAVSKARGRAHEEVGCVGIASAMISSDLTDLVQYLR